MFWIHQEKFSEPLFSRHLIFRQHSRADRPNWWKFEWRMIEGKSGTSIISKRLTASQHVFCKAQTENSISRLVDNFGHSIEGPELTTQRPSCVLHTLATKAGKGIDKLPTDENSYIHSRERFDVAEFTEQMFPLKTKRELQLFKSSRNNRIHIRLCWMAGIQPMVSEKKNQTKSHGNLQGK